MSRPVIFLDPSVLMYEPDRAQDRFDQPACFDENALRGFNDLIRRVENVAIVLVFPREEGRGAGPSLEWLQAKYQNCGFEDRIISKIDDSFMHQIDDGELVSDWLHENAISSKPFPIGNFVIINPSNVFRHREKSVFVRQDFLSEKNVVLAEEILRNPPTTTYIGSPSTGRLWRVGRPRDDSVGPQGCSVQ